MHRWWRDIRMDTVNFPVQVSVEEESEISLRTLVFFSRLGFLSFALRRFLAFHVEFLPVSTRLARDRRLFPAHDRKRHKT
jgi:hypothetical protein